MYKRILSLLVLALSAILAGCMATVTETTTVATTVAETTTIATTSVLDGVKALSNPYRTALFMNGAPGYVNVNFELSGADDGVVAWYPETDPDAVTTAAATRKTTLVGLRTVYTYAATIGPLSPGGHYRYRVGNAAGDATDVWRTYEAPVLNLASFTFAVFADPQENDQLGYMAFAHAFMSVRDYAGADIAFGLFVGDFVNDHDVRAQWDWFLRYASAFAVERPIVATIGNHEHSDFSGDRMNNMEYDAYTNLPQNGPTYAAFDELDGDDRPATIDRGKTYSFDYGAAHFVAIDTEILCDASSACGDRDRENAQILVDWLAADLAASDAEWTIVFLHRGPYSLTYDSAGIRETLVPVFDAYGVDLVLSGHDHIYSRSIYSVGSPVAFARSDIYALGTVSLLDQTADGLDFNDYPAASGVTYLVGNSAGTKFYDNTEHSGIYVQYEYNGNNPVIPLVTVTADEITVVAYVLFKGSKVDIVPQGVAVLETFKITK